MPLLTDSIEWCLLQRLAVWLSQVKALPMSDRIGSVEPDILDYELRHTLFIVQTLPQSLDQSQFEHCQIALKDICTLLNELAGHQSNHDKPISEEYPQLRALIRTLKPTSEAIGLVNGPSKLLFELPSDAATLQSSLTIVTECNKVLSRLHSTTLARTVLQLPQERRKKNAWKENRMRNEALCILRTLFKHFSNCGMSHEILLKLIGDPNKDTLLSSLQLMLSSCPELELWQEVQCENINLNDDSISHIPDICTDIRLHTGQRRSLMLRIKEYEVYGAWLKPVSSGLDPSSKRSLSLHQLIENGAFKRLDIEDMQNNPSPIKFSTKDKRKLAVKLGYYLMDFFDADFASNKIHFFDSSTPSSMEIPYLAFDSEFSTTENSYSFQIGHRTLLSFAKLLLELEFGQVVKLEVSPDSGENRIAWGKLMLDVDILERDKRDSYIEAIRGCFGACRKIAQMLESRDLDGTDADAKIRRIIYKHIVYKLELGHAESIPRLSGKRQQSESFLTFDREDEVQNPGSGEMAIRSAESPHTPRQNKRRRARELQRWLSPVNIKSFLKENLNSLKKDVLKPGTPSNLDRPKSRKDFEIALICALQIESDAVEALFDDYYELNPLYGKALGDPNAYTIGRMSGYNVVMAFMPGMGKVNSANVAAGFRMSFPNIKLGIVVGICGGVPGGEDGEKEVLLGDVIISTALKQYDFGRQYDNKTETRNTLQDSLSRPNMEIRSFLKKYSGLRGRNTLREKTSSHLEALCAKNDFEGSLYPGVNKDVLYLAAYRHKHRDLNICSVCANCRNPNDKVCDDALDSSCAELGCEDSMTVSRARIEKAKSIACSTATRRDAEFQEAQKPLIHFGTIACGDSVMKSGLRRDEIALREKVIAFEMEGAGVWDSFPTVVIKSVCDYADSHKNKMWQNYAAATAAACMKAFLEEWRKAC